MRIFGGQFPFLWRDRKPRRSSVFAYIRDVIAENFDPGRPSDQHEGALHRRSARAPFSPVGMIVSLAIIAALGVVSCSFVAIAGKATQKGAAQTSSSLASLIAEASQRFGVPAHWIRAVMQVESAGDKGAVSPKGAMGLMQIMPETYAELRLRYHFGADPYAPRDNILAGAAYLREMRDRFGPGGFLAAYNAGPGRYDDYLKRGRPLPEETRNYVAALAPVIGVPGIPQHPGSASKASQWARSSAARDSGEQLKAQNRSTFTSAISQFDARQNARSMTLFAIVRSVFEPTSAVAQTVDITALEPAPGHALTATSTAAESLRILPSKTPPSSLTPSGKALFVARSTPTSR